MAGGYVVAPFNLLAQDSHLDFVLGPRAAAGRVREAECAGRLRDACARSGAATRIVEVGVDGLGLDAATARARADVTGDQPAMLMYTSGTTGCPRACCSRMRACSTRAPPVAGAPELGASDRVLSSLPLYHINGQCIATASTLVSGGSMVMPHRFSASQWWPLVERYRPTWLNVVPTIIAYLLNGPDPTPAQREALADVRYARSASAPLSPDQQRAFESRFGIPVIEAMGLTESASVAFCNPMDPAARRIGSPGLPLAVTARVVVARWRDAPRRRARADRDQGSERHARVFPRAGADGARRFRAMAGSPRAISAIATTTASTSSPAARRSSSSRAARTSRRARSTRRCCAILRSWKRSRSACPTASTARTSRRSSS